jgi:hypothetical protein
MTDKPTKGEVAEGLDSERETVPPVRDIETNEFASSDYESWGGNTVPSANEVRAASIIQNAYRCCQRSASHRHGSVSSVTARDRSFKACLAEAQKIAWIGGNYYRKLFLGPLPHVLLCLEKVGSYAVTTREQVKKLTVTAEGQELQDLSKQQTATA